MKQNEGIGGLGRFAEPAVLVLVSLADHPKHGYAIAADVQELSGVRMGPVVRCWRGVQLPAIQRLAAV